MSWCWITGSCWSRTSPVKDKCKCKCLEFRARFVDCDWRLCKCLSELVGAGRSRRKPIGKLQLWGKRFQFGDDSNCLGEFPTAMDCHSPEVGSRRWSESERCCSHHK